MTTSETSEAGACLFYTNPQSGISPNQHTQLRFHTHLVEDIGGKSTLETQKTVCLNLTLGELFKTRNLEKHETVMNARRHAGPLRHLSRA